jgi:hypothetical protein
MKSYEICERKSCEWNNENDEHGLFIGFYRFFGLVVARLHSSSRFQALPPWPPGPLESLGPTESKGANPGYAMWYTIYIYNDIYIYSHYVSNYIYLYPTLSIYIYLYLSISTSIYLSIFLTIYLSIKLPTYLSIYRSIDRSIYLSISISISISIHDVYVCKYIPVYLMT